MGLLDTVFNFISGNSAQKSNEGLAANNIAFQKEQAELERARQKEFAQMGIQWRVADAKAAGVHPLAALGASGAASSPITVSGGDPPYRKPASISGIDDFLSEQMGQNLTRARTTQLTPAAAEMEGLALERARKENQLLDARIAAQWSSVLGQPPTPAMPGGGPGVFTSPVMDNRPRVVPRDLVKVEPGKVTSSRRDDVGTEAGPTPFLKDYNLGWGMSVPMPSQQAAESLEGMGAFGHFVYPAAITARLGARWLYGPQSGPPDSRLEWSPTRQAWVPKSRSRIPALPLFGSDIFRR